MRRLRTPARSAIAPMRGAETATISAERETARPLQKSPRPVSFPTMYDV
jgi:hypothetical protein